MRFGFLDKYKLELHWNKVDYFIDQKAKLVGAYFSGPALKIAQKIRPNDRITLDLSNMYRVFVPNYYLSKLQWEEVNYGQFGEVHLVNAVLEGIYLNSVPKLKDTDFFVIDTSKHEDKIHAFYFTYDAVLLNENREIYKF